MRPGASVTTVTTPVAIIRPKIAHAAIPGVDGLH
jgi:hypothetical protein